METISITILAHNEERRISLCLDSVLADAGDAPVHVIVNGSTDRTAEIARSLGDRVSVYDYAQGGKSRSWNAFVLDADHGSADVRIFVDGDAIVAPGSFEALTSALVRNRGANAAAGQPLNGRNVAAYRAEQAANGGVFGDLYALRGSFIDRMKAGGFRLPDDLIGDDGLIGALAKIDLVWGGEWRNDRVVVVPDAGFYAEAFNPLSPASLRGQYRRMINYSVRHFQNRIIGVLMRDPPPPRFCRSGWPIFIPDFWMASRRVGRHRHGGLTCRHWHECGVRRGAKFVQKDRASLVPQKAVGDGARFGFA